MFFLVITKDAVQLICIFWMALLAFLIFNYRTGGIRDKKVIRYIIGFFLAITVFYFILTVLD